MASERTGLLIIRAWIEQGSSETLRAEVRIVSDVPLGDERKLTFCRADLVCGTVQKWLDDFMMETALPE